MSDKYNRTSSYDPYLEEREKLLARIKALETRLEIVEEICGIKQGVSNEP